MEGLDDSEKKLKLSKTLQQLQGLEQEKEDIVRGFIKEKEIIEHVHEEQIAQLEDKHQQELDELRAECSRERESMLRKADGQQVECTNIERQKAKQNEKQLLQKSKEDKRETESIFETEKRKLREEYEFVIAQKTSEIEELYRENCILRSKSDPESFEDKNKDTDIRIHKLESEFTALKRKGSNDIKEIKKQLEFEISELERNHIREKAEFVKKLTTKFDEQNDSNALEKNRSFVMHQQEVKEKIQIVEDLWEERNIEERKKMNTRFDHDIDTLKLKFSEDLEEKLLEKDSAIEKLEEENEYLSNSIHVERFELAKYYNRELSILNRLDSPSKEDIEVALIDEVAKLRDEQQRLIRDMERRHKRKIKDLKEAQKPLSEIEEQHKNDIEELTNNYEREKEEFEAQLRNEQLHLLKSFEFEKNDIERYYKKLIEHRENEIEEEIENIQQNHEMELEKLNLLVKENDDFKRQRADEKQEKEGLIDRLQECESQNSRLKEAIEKQNRGKREQIEKPGKGQPDREGLKKTVKNLSSSNILLSEELEKERKKNEKLLDQIHELEQAQSVLPRADEKVIQKDDVSGREVASSFEQDKRNMKDESNAERFQLSNNTVKDAIGSPTTTQDLEKEMELQDSLQEYLTELKALQDSMDLKDAEIKHLKDEFQKERSELNGKIQDLKDTFQSVMDDEVDDDEKARLKSKLSDAINQQLKGMDRSSKPSEDSSKRSMTNIVDHEDINDFCNEVKALDDLMSEEINDDDTGKEIKEKINNKLKAIKRNIMRSHELEKLKQQQKHEQEKNRYLKELNDERQAELNLSEEVWKAVCEKLGLEEDESNEKLKEILQEKRPQSNEMDDIELQTEEKENAGSDSDELIEIRKEKEDLERSVKELQKHFDKEKKNIMEKMQTQHKEFVLSPEAEVIEKLIKEKLALEEESNIERFNLSRIYYMEMKDELDDILSQRKDDMKKDFDMEKIEIILKFNKDIADLHKTIADKDENEVKLLKDKNAMVRKVLELQRRTPNEEPLKDEGESDKLKTEVDKLETALPLKEEIAELQRQRQEEHESNINHLDKAIEMIKELLAEKPKAEDASLGRRYSFVSVDSGKGDLERVADQDNQLLSRASTRSHRSVTLKHQPLSSDDEIYTKEDLQKALENLIVDAFTEGKDYESNSSSGASSDFDSEPSSPASESEEGGSDSGAESIENECFSVKKSDLNLAMNLERFSLGRIYYNEYKDSLKNALKKLAKAKEGNHNLENELQNSVKGLVERTNFGKTIRPTMEAETQTLDIEESEDKQKAEHPVDNETMAEVHEKERDNEKANAQEKENTIKEQRFDEEKPDVDDDNQHQSPSKDKKAKHDSKENTEQQAVAEEQQQYEETSAIVDHNSDNIQRPRPRPRSRRPREEISKEDDKNTKENQAENKESKEEFRQKWEDHEEKEKLPLSDTMPDFLENLLPDTDKQLQDQKKTEDKVEYIIEPIFASVSGLHMLGSTINKEGKAKAKEKPDKNLDDIETGHEVKPESETESSPQVLRKTPEIERNSANQDRKQDRDKEDKQIETKKIEDDDDDDARGTPTTHNDPNEKAKNNESSKDDKRLDDLGKHANEETGEGGKIQIKPPSKKNEFHKEKIPVEVPKSDTDPNKLERENKELNDKLNILKALVGKWFVEEIPELRAKKESEEKYSGTEIVDENELSELCEEEKNITMEIKDIQQEIDVLKNMSDSNIKDEEKKWNEQELDALKQLEKVEHTLKREEDKDLIEHLRKEKKDVCKKLEEIDRDIGEQEENIADNEKKVFDLIKKKIELEERVSHQARDLDKNQKKLSLLDEDKQEIQKQEKQVDSLKEQQNVLENLLVSPPTSTAKPSLPSNIAKIMKTRETKDHEAEKVAKKIELTKRDKNRYQRMVEDRTVRLKPFLKKQQRLQKAIEPSDKEDDKRDEKIIEDDASEAIQEAKQSVIKEDEIQKEQQSKMGDVGIDNIIDDKDENISHCSPLGTNATKEESDMGEHEIEQKLQEVMDQITEHRKNVKIPIHPTSANKSLPIHIQELQSNKDDVDSQISNKQAMCENMDIDVDFGKVCNLLESKSGLEARLKEIEETLPDGFKYLPKGIQETYQLVCSNNEIEIVISDVDRLIDQEETNFIEAVKYQRKGKLEDATSAIKDLLDSKENLLNNLREIPNKITDQIGSEAQSEAEQKEFEDQIQQKLENEELLEKIQDRIEEEPSRAAATLEELIDSKQKAEEEQIDTASALKQAKDQLNMTESKGNISDAIWNAICLENKDNDIKLEFAAVRRALENQIKEKAKEIYYLKKQQKDTKHEEDELVEIIEKQKSSREELPLTKKVTDDATVLVSVSVFKERNEIKEDLKNIKGNLEAEVAEQNNEMITAEIAELDTLFETRAERQKQLDHHIGLANLLEQKEQLEKRLDVCNKLKELDEIEQLVRHKEREIERLQGIADDAENLLGDLMGCIKENVAHESDLENAIKDALTEVQTRLLEAEQETGINSKNVNQTESNIKETLSSLEDELEESREEMEFVENELESLHSDSESESAISPGLLELTKLLNSKKNHKEYLFEIDTKLDNSDNNTDRVSKEEMDALKSEKREAERKLIDIQEEKSKFEVELQDEEIKETYNSLCEEKVRLDDKRKALLAEIHGPNIFSKMAEEMEEEKPSEGEQKYYAHALGQMISDHKTLIKLAEENEKLKEVASRQRALIENLNNRIVASLGEDLAQVIARGAAIDDKRTCIPNAILDRVTNQDETIAAILDDLNSENENIRDLNEELLKDLDCIKEKLGENLLDAILKPNDNKRISKWEPIAAVINGETTVQGVLEDQNDALDKVEETLGNNLYKSLLKPTTDDSVDILRAPKIMKENDEDLETVIAAYEYELESLGKHNDVLKNMLGNDLVHALLYLGQDKERKQILDQDTLNVEATAAKPAEDEYKYDTSKFKERNINNLQPRKERMNIPELDRRMDKPLQSTDQETGRTGTESPPEKQLADQIPEDKDIQVVVPSEQPYFSSRHRHREWTNLEEEQGTRETGVDFNNDIEFSQYGLAAPLRMADKNTTLGEVIRGYENDLDILKSRLGPNLYKDVLDTGKNVNDGAEISRTGSKNEMLTKKQMPLAPITSRDVVRDDIQGVSYELPEDVATPLKTGSPLSHSTQEDSELLENRLQKISVQDSPIAPEAVRKQTMEKEGFITKAADEIGFSNSVVYPATEHTAEEIILDIKNAEVTIEKPALIALVSMVKHDKTLEEVIKNYEDDLALLNSKLGPDLYNCLLDAAEREPIAIKTTSSSQNDEVKHKAEEQDENVEVVKGREIGNGAKQQITPEERIDVSKLDRRTEKPLQSTDQETEKIGTESPPKKQLADRITEDEDIQVVVPSERPDFSSSDQQREWINLEEQQGARETGVDFNNNIEFGQYGLAAPLRMAEQNTTLGEVIKGYENDLNILKSRLGPNLYKDVLDTGKNVNDGAEISRTGSKYEMLTKKQMPLAPITSLDVVCDDIQGVSYEQPENVETPLKTGSPLSHSTQEDSELSENQVQEISVRDSPIALEGVRKQTMEKEGFITKAADEIGFSNSVAYPETEHIAEEIFLDINNTEVTIEKPALIALVSMVKQDKTLEEVIKNYEDDLAFLNSKLGPDLYNCVLDAAKREPIAIETTSLSQSDEVEDKAKEQNENVEVAKDHEIGNKAKQQTIPKRKESEDKTREEGSKLSKDSQENKHEKETKNRTNISDISQEHQEPRNEVHQHLNAADLLAEQNNTLQDIIEKYERDLDIFNASLGPSLAKAVLEAGIKKKDQYEGDDSFSTNREPHQYSEEMTTKDGKQKIYNSYDAKTLNQIPKQEQIRNDLKQNLQDDIQVDKEEETSQGQENQDSNNDIRILEAKIQLDTTLEMLEQDMTLEDVIKKLEQQSHDLELKIGPNLTRMLLEQVGKNKAEKVKGKGKLTSDRIGGRKEKKEDTSDKYVLKPDLEPKQSMSQKVDLVSSEKASRLSEKDEGKEAVQKKSIPENPEEQNTTVYFRDIPERISLLAPELMENQDSPLEDVIQTYENELCVLKNALGPNLVDILLSNAQKDKEIKRLDNQLDSEDEHANLYELGKEEDTKVTQHEENMQQKTPQDVKEKVELKYKDAEFEDEKEVFHLSLGQDENSMKPIHQKSRDLESIVSPLLDKDENITLEEIIENLNDDLQTINDKLGPKLSKSLSKNKKTHANKNLDVSDEMTEIRVGANTEDQKRQSEGEIREEKKQEKEKEHTELAALHRMEKESQTLEEVIKQYEDNLNIYEARLGPYLSKVILTAQESQEEKPSLEIDTVQGDSKTEQVYTESSVPDMKTEDGLKSERLQEPLKMIGQGKTLEDILSNYEQDRDILKLVQSSEDGSPISISDITATYNEQIDKLKKDNFEVRNDLDNLSAKIGPDLISQLRHESEENLDTAKHDRKTKKVKEESRKGDQMSEPAEDRTRKQNCSLEAPAIMAQNHQTLENVIAEYEAQLKEMIKTQEQLKSELDILEQSMGPTLFRELCEFKEIEEVFDNSEADTKTTKDRDSSTKDDTPRRFHGKSDFEALNRMAEKEKPLANILEDYQSECETLERENKSMRKALKNVSGDGENVSDIISEYENQILLLENLNKEAEKKFEEKHNELQNEVDDLRTTLEKLAQTLRQDFLDDLVNQQEGDTHIEALDIMEKENKTLADVVEEYEDNMKKLEREKAVLQQISGQSTDGTSMLDKINDYEDAIRSLKDVNKVLNRRIDALTETIGPELTVQIMSMSENEKQKSGQIQDEPKKCEMAAVKRMRQDNVTLEEVLKSYENQIENLGLVEQATTDDKAISARKDEECDESQVVDEDSKLSDKGKKMFEDFKKETTNLDQTEEQVLKKEPKKNILVHNEESTPVEENRSNDIPSKLDHAQYRLHQRIGETLVDDINDLDNKTIEELEKEDRKPYALRTMKSGNDKLEDIIKAYEKMLFEYGLLDVNKEQSKSLASELQDVMEEDAVEIDNNDIGLIEHKELEELRQQLKEEIGLKEKYEKDVKDLLNDIVKLKMKSAGDDEDREDIERQIKEEYETKQKNKRLEEELAKQKDRNKNLEGENEGLKSKIQNMEKEIKALEKHLEEMQDEIGDGENLKSKIRKLSIKNEELENKHNMENNNNTDDIREFNQQIAQLKLKNETLKEQLDYSEASMKEALGKYQEEIKSLEVEMSKIQEEKKHQIELLKNKLELEKAAHKRLRNEYDELLRKEKERLLEDFEKDFERERRRMKNDLDEQNEDLMRKEKRHNVELEDIKKKAEREKEEISDNYKKEKERLQKAFEEKVRKQKEEHEKILNELREKLEDQMITQQAEMNIQFRQEKTVFQANIEKNIYGEEIQKNLDLESDFQGTLNKVLKDHAIEIEDIAQGMRQAEERFKEQKLQLLEDFEMQKEKLTKESHKVKHGMETTIENLLKEVIKLKHQRKEMRQQHRLDKQQIEELFEKERNEIQDSMQRSKIELVAKLKEDNEREILHEREKYEAVIKELQEALDRTEAKRKELEEKLRNESFKAEESKLNNEADKDRPIEVTKQVKVIKRGIEIEYEHKLNIEKQRFEDTLQGLRREVGNLQEKRKIIQERVYNQENYSAEKHVIEKSIANYKMEVLSKLEGEMTHRLERERKPLEEEVKELQIENEELKRQRWEMKAQFRREKAALEEESEKEKETLETNFNKEKEELRKRLETKLHKEKLSKSLEVKISRATSPVHAEYSPRIDNTVRMLQQENVTLASQNAKHEEDIEELTNKLQVMEINFEEMKETAKPKAEKMKTIQEQIPKTVTFAEEASPTPAYKLPSSGIHDDAILRTLQEKDQQIHQLLETKIYYESVLGELGEEAGLFELDRNQVV